MDINAPKIEYFESFANEITSKFRRLQAIIGHPTASGDYHEEVLRIVLRNFLSKRFSVKKGFIYAGPGKISKQIDIIIVDESSPVAYIFQEGDFSIVIPQAVVAIMEIKTSFNAKEFDQAIENIVSAKSIMEFPTSITGIVFGFDGTNPTKEILDSWFKRKIPTEFKGREKLSPDAFLFFSANKLIVRCNENAEIASYGKYYHYLNGTDNKNWILDGVAFQLSTVLALIIKACENKQFAMSHYFDDSQVDNFFQPSQSGLSLERFGFGDGMSLFKIL